MRSTPVTPAQDAKKSPLALLAMTCSNIGADVLGAGKPMIAFERHKKSRSDAGDSVRSESANSDKIQANSIDSNRSNSRNSICASDVTTNCTGTGQKISFKPYEDSPKSSSRDQQHRTSSKTNGATNNHSNHSSSSHNDDGCGSRKRSSDAISPKRSPGGSSPKRSSSSSSHSENNNHKNSSSSASSSSPSNVISYTSTGLLELSKNHQLSKAVCDSSASSGFPAAAQLSHFPHAVSHHNHDHHNHPYNSSATCRDPFCSGCNLSSLSGLSSASAAGGNCCNGLSACTHTKAADHPFAAFPLGLNPLSHHLSRFSNGLPSQKPFPCQWTANGSYCGKSFATCEELLQHLKTHTSSSNSQSAAYANLGYYSQALGAAAIRPYGLDDLRYHPYKMSGPAAAAAAAAAAFPRPPVSLASAGYPMMTPPMSMYPPGQHSSLSSYYALLHGRLAGHGSLH